MPDIFQHHQTHLTAPYEGGFDVTPNDSTDLATWARGLWIDGAGTIKVTMANDTAVTLTIPAAGFELKGYRIRRVWSTGTTATGIKAFY